MQINPKLLCARLKDVQDLDACDATELVASNGNELIVMHDVHIVPRLEAAHDLVMRLFIFLLEVTQRLIRKNDAPAERIIWPVALEEIDLDIRTPLFYKDRKIKT